jgi:hypothetical protein
MNFRFTLSIATARLAKSQLLIVHTVKGILVLTLSLCATSTMGQTPDADHIVYVTPDATGDGSSWSNATGNLHAAINAAGVQKVFVAIGNYNVGDHSFVMKKNVEIYGGFDPANNIKSLHDARILPNQGASEGSVLNGENVRPVIWNDFPENAPLDNTAILDGFTLKNGKNEGGPGGAIRNEYSSAVFRNLVIKNNTAKSGGGIYIYMVHHRRLLIPLFRTISLRKVEPVFCVHHLLLPELQT